MGGCTQAGSHPQMAACLGTSVPRAEAPAWQFPQIVPPPREQCQPLSQPSGDSSRQSCTDLPRTMR